MKIVATKLKRNWKIALTTDGNTIVYHRLNAYDINLLAKLNNLTLNKTKSTKKQLIYT